MHIKIILIAGGTASGKTTITKALHNQLKAVGSVSIIELDSYYLPLSHLSPEQRDKVNFDHPRQFEIDLLVKHLKDLINGISVFVPQYDYVIHDRIGLGKEVAPAQYILVDGILALHFEELRDLASHKIFVDTTDAIRLERRLKRDIAERGRTKESVIEWWDTRVQPMHLEFCEPSKKFAELIVSGENDCNLGLQKIITYLNR